MSSGQNACLIRATSLDFICEDHDDQAVLSTCDSFVCGGQVEPTTDIVSKDSEHMPDVDGVTEQLAMSKAFFYKHRLNGECIQDGISNLLAGYPVLAGRLGRVADTDQACIWLVNGGVSFREIACPASSDCFKADELDMKQWMSGGLPAWIEPMDCKKLRQGQEPLLKVALIQLADEASILSVTLAHCIADGSGFTRLLQTLALMCSNQPGLPMMFGAGHLLPPQPMRSKLKLEPNDPSKLIQEHLHQASLVFKPHTDLGSRIKLASRLMPGLCSSMAGRKCKEVLYLPSKVVQALKVKMQLLVPKQKLSTNDVLSAVLWHVACDIRSRPRPCQPTNRGHGCLAYPSNLRSMHVPQHYCGNALLVNLLGGGEVARSETAVMPAAYTCCGASHAGNHQTSKSGYKQSIMCSTDKPDLQQLACCASRISRHTSEARLPGTVHEALEMVNEASQASALAKRLGLCVLGVDVDLWVSNWSNLYQLEGMQIGNVKPYMFLGHSIGPQLGTAAVILQPDMSCYHVDWYIPARLTSKLVNHTYWASILPGAIWL